MPVKPDCLLAEMIPQKRNRGHPGVPSRIPSAVRKAFCLFQVSSPVESEGPVLRAPTPEG